MAEEATVAAYDPPGYLTDFDAIPGQLEAWSDAVSGWFDEVIAQEEKVLPTGEPCQYYNQLRTPVSGPIFEQSMVWNAFSGTLRNRFGRTAAFEAAEHVYPLTQRIDGPGFYYLGGQWENLFYRPHDEYCEYRVERDPDGGIRRIVFTSEPPEYWQALHGDTLQDFEGNPKYPVPGDRDLLVQLYQELVSPEVVYDDLVCQVDLVDYSQRKPTVAYPKGSYNPYNKWNTTQGIVHLTHPANSLSAEIKLGGDGTVLRAKGQRPVVDPDALICCAAYGGTNRNTDPTIGASANELAALGFYITIANPVGLYMDHIDLAGFATPAGDPIGPEYFQIVRGKPGYIERAIFEAPEGEAFRVSDLTYGGTPIRYGGQIAEHIVVRLVAQAAEPGKFHNTPVGCAGACCEDDCNRNFLYYREPGSQLFPSVAGQPCAPGRQPAFDYPSPAPAAVTVGAPEVRAEPATRPPHRVR